MIILGILTVIHRLWHYIILKLLILFFNTRNRSKKIKKLKKISLVLAFLGLCGSISWEISSSYSRGSFWLLRTQENGKIEVEWLMVLFTSYQVIFPLLSMIFFSHLKTGVPANNYKITWLRWLNKINGFFSLLIFSIIGSAISFGAITFDPLAALFSLSTGLLFAFLGWRIGIKYFKKKLKERPES